MVFPENGNERLGLVVSGSLTHGIDIKLDGDVSLEDMAVGRFVTIQGRQRRFFGVITDISLAATDDSLAATPPDVSDPFVARVVSGISAFGTLHVVPYLSMGADAQILPAKTIPPHFTVARGSDPKEIQMIFGENDDRHIWIGSPLDMEEAPVCLDTQRLVERSTGVFGKTGTGKSFLTRILLAEIIQKGSRAAGKDAQPGAVSLIFDMHGEYGWGHRSEDGAEAKGLKQLFPSKVVVFTLDENSARARGIHADFPVQIGYGDIEAEDIATLAATWSMTDAMVQAAYRLQKKLGRGWVKKFLDAQSTEDLAGLGGAFEHEGTLDALRRRLETLERFPFLAATARDDTVGRLIGCLDRGMHVVLEFGSYANNLPAYILVANLLTRRIHDRYVERMELALGKNGKEPRPLIIALEEAHKFLSPELAGQTTFGTIARELRKYNVTLLVIDQRPSGIDGEIMSQLGTKITCLLENDRDIEAVLAGVSGSRELRAVLAKLETRQQALIFGHAVPMPVVIRTRAYDGEFYQSLGIGEQGGRPGAAVDADTDDLFR